MLGVFSTYSFSQNFNNISENKTFTADNSTNHIWTMTRTLGVYDDISITVNLNKATFENVADANIKFGFGEQAIPANWDFEIISVKDDDSNELTKVGKTFTFEDDPNETITVRVNSPLLAAHRRY